VDQEKKNVKKTIMEFAEVLFAQKGFDGISIDELAKEAKVNKSLIYYYFSSKEGLLISLIQKHITEFEQLMSKLQLDQSKRIDELMEEIIKLAINYICENENIIKIMQHESLLDKKTRHKPIDIITFIDPLWEKIETTFKNNFHEVIDVNFIDKAICIMLIINFSIILDRINKSDPEEVEVVKKLYADRITKIVRMVVSDVQSH
jgi:AcrR family transcriptional regulator